MVDVSAGEVPLVHISQPLVHLQHFTALHLSSLSAHMAALRYLLAFASIFVILLILFAGSSDAQSRGSDAILADQVTGVLLKKVWVLREAPGPLSVNTQQH